MGNNCLQFLNKNMLTRASMLCEKSFFSAVCSYALKAIYTFGGYENIERG